MHIQSLTAGISDCACGKQHTCPIDHVVIERNAAESFASLCIPYQRILLVSDENTWDIWGKDIFAAIETKVETNLILAANGDVVIPNEEKIAEIEAVMTDATDLVIGVGSGVINDLCKITSFRRDLPYFIAATAPSMDGYASNGSALILEGMKITLNARPPKAIVADVDVLKDAPMPMLRAGYGDIMGKYSCLNDWKLSALLFDEYLCQTVYDITYDAVKNVERLADGIASRDADAVKALMEALVIVGITMAYVGNSRPASGSEHHLSHFFEITGILENKPYLMHGIDVAYSSVVTASLREKIISSKPHLWTFERAAWESEIKRIYGTAADGVIALQNKLGWYERDEYSVLCEKWDAVTALLKEAPTSSQTKAIMEKVGLDFSEFESLYGEKKIADAVLYAKDLKDRYSVLWLWDKYFA